MNCSDAERRIYLYQELTPVQRDETDRHMVSCASCQRLMAKVNDERKILNHILHAPHALPDAGITNRVISTVHEIQQKRTSPGPSLKLVYAPVRYAMALISLFLVVTFVNEYKYSLKSTDPVAVYARSERKPKLNSASFYEALAKPKSKDKRASIYECIEECLRTVPVNCAACSVKFSKLNEAP